jgi:hypothetical protein
MGRSKKEVILGEIVEPTITDIVSEDYNQGNIDYFTEKNEEKTEEKSTMTIKNVKQLDYAGRGFKSIDEAFAFVDTEYFKGLGKEDQEEFINWLY